MARLRLSVEARRDLRRISETGIEQHGPAASADHIEGFRRLFRLLRDQPFAGPERPKLGRNVRTLSHRPHLILYCVNDDLVVVDCILHQARDLGRALREDQ